MGWQHVPRERQPRAELELAPGGPENTLGDVKMKGYNLEKPGQITSSEALASPKCKDCNQSFGGQICRSNCNGTLDPACLRDSLPGWQLSRRLKFGGGFPSAEKPQQPVGATPLPAIPGMQLGRGTVRGPRQIWLLTVP